MSQTSPTVFLLYREVSDQYGTDEVVGVFTSREKAEAVTAGREPRFGYRKDQALG